MLDGVRKGKWQLWVPWRLSSRATSQRGCSCHSKEKSNEMFVLYITLILRPQRRQRPQKTISSPVSKSSALHPPKPRGKVRPRFDGNRRKGEARTGSAACIKNGLSQYRFNLPRVCPTKASTPHLFVSIRLWFVLFALPRHFLAKSWLHTTQLDPTPHPAPNPMNALLIPGEPENRARGR